MLRATYELTDYISKWVPRHKFCTQKYSGTTDNMLPWHLIIWLCLLSLLRHKERQQQKHNTLVLCFTKFVSFLPYINFRNEFIIGWCEVQVVIYSPSRTVQVYMRNRNQITTVAFQRLAPLRVRPSAGTLLTVLQPMLFKFALEL